MEEFLDSMRPKPQTCPTVGTQKAKVCLPVSVSPYAITGPVTIKCCGEAHVESSCKHCPGKPNGNCDFIISQKIKVEVPVEFGATVNIGETFVECECAKDEGFDLDCGCKEDYDIDDKFDENLDLDKELEDLK